MKIRSVKANNHKKAFEVRTYKGAYDLPFAKVDLRPTKANPVTKLFVDEELGEEAFTYTVASGNEDTIHVDQVLEYNRDPAYMRDLLLYKLTIEAKKLVESTELSKRELSKRLGTSPTQLYRLLDEENYRKTIDQLVNLMSVLDCPVDLVMRRSRKPVESDKPRNAL